MGDTEDQRIPKLRDGVDVTGLPLGPAEGFILSRIDGYTRISDISELTGFGTETVCAVVDLLVEAGAAEWTGSTKGALPSFPEPITTALPPRPLSARAEEAAFAPTEPPPPPDAAPARAEPSYDPAELEEPGVELPLELRRKILEAYRSLERATHYELLGLSMSADKAEVRTAYFALSKVFHTDTAYGKNLGSFKGKMEAVFKRLTEAYEVLGRKRKREDYDAYLKLCGHAEALEEELVSEATPLPASEPPASSAAKREWIAEKLSRAAAEAARHAPASPADPRSSARELARTLKGTAHVTGGVDVVRRQLDAARRHEAAGDLVEALKSLRVAQAAAPDDPAVAAEEERVGQLVAAGLAGEFAEKARYEEQAQRWAQAALSWSKVCRGRPDDFHAHCSVANCMLRAAMDLSSARRFAQRAIEISPERAEGHKALGMIFLAAEMHASARGSLERARELDPADPSLDRLLKELR